MSFLGGIGKALGGANGLFKNPLGFAQHALGLDDVAGAAGAASGGARGIRGLLSGKINFGDALDRFGAAQAAVNGDYGSLMDQMRRRKRRQMPGDPQQDAGMGPPRRPGLLNLHGMQQDYE